MGGQARWGWCAAVALAAACGTAETATAPATTDATSDDTTAPADTTPPADKQVIADWAKAGAPEGNAQDAKPATPLALDLQGIDVTPKPPSPRSPA